MQNKANFRKSQMNVTKVLTMEYKNKTLSRSGKNKANSKPNKANLLKAKMNLNFYSTKDYENELCRKLQENKPNTNPIQTQSNPISHQRTTNPEQRTNNNQTQFQRQNYNKSFLKRHLKIVKKIQFFLRLLLHYCAYSDILLHISEDITLCS